MINDEQTTPVPDVTPALQRRFLLRGGAVLAGAAGITAVGAAMGSSTANAADGAPLVLGALDNTETSTTELTITGDPSPALTLTNAQGAALRLSPVASTFTGPLEPGDLVGTDVGPLVGVDYGDGSEVDYLVTGSDLDYIPITVPVSPERLLDTRSARGRSNILRGSSAAPLDTAGRLKANSWIDVAVSPADDGFELAGVFVNTASGSSLGNGYLTVYLPGDRPGVSTINFQKGMSVANGALVQPGIIDGVYAIRIHTSQATHILLDLSGVIISAPTSGAMVTSQARQRRTVRQAKRAAKMRKSLRSVQ